ncbi:hypothetical protein AB0C52_23765 [Streptomyces sp. NPDC048717]|uniref:hypothetical protein n=1 Tax=Streptomyces sp. NPDC048717 TaxID=3154928 RepID=UPI003423EB2A
MGISGPAARRAIHAAAQAPTFTGSIRARSPLWTSPQPNRTASRSYRPARGEKAAVILCGAKKPPRTL